MHKIDDKFFNITTFEVNGFRLHSWKGLASLDKPRSSATAAECGLLVSKIITSLIPPTAFNTTSLFQGSQAPSATHPPWAAELEQLLRAPESRGSSLQKGGRGFKMLIKMCCVHVKVA